MTNRSEDEPAELSSPACSMSEADDTYMGYAGRAELVGFLNELLEAERAGARVTLKSAREAGAALSPNCCGPFSGMKRVGVRC